MSPDNTVGERSTLKISVDEVNAARKSMTVEVPAEEVSGEYDKACRAYARDLRVPGFRQGKVPLHIIRQRFGREIRQETVEKVVESALGRAVREAKLSPLKDPVLKDYKYTPGEPLSFTAEVEVLPKIEVASHKEIKVKVKKPAVTDKMVFEALDSLRERAAKFEPVEGRGIRPGDHAVMDVEMSFPTGGGDDAKHQNVLVEIGSGGPHPELTDNLRDALPGQTREFAVAYPKEHPNRRTAGRRVGYRVKIREIKQKVLPDLNDDFARDLGKFSSLEELRAKVTEDLTRREERRSRDEARGEALTQLLQGNPDVPVPEVLIERELSRRVEDLVQSMALQGMDPRKASVDWDEIREKQRDSATKSVRAMILLDAIAEAEKISVEPEALAAALSDEAARQGQPPEALRAKLTKDGRLERLTQQLLRDKVLDMMLATANT